MDTTLTDNQKNYIQQSINKQSSLLPAIFEEIKKKGGTPYLVGGAVRDIFLGLPVKDIDMLYEMNEKRK